MLLTDFNKSYRGCSSHVGKDSPQHQNAVWRRRLVFLIERIGTIISLALTAVFPISVKIFADNQSTGSAVSPESFAMVAMAGIVGTIVFQNERETTIRKRRDAEMVLLLRNETDRLHEQQVQLHRMTVVQSTADSLQRDKEHAARISEQIEKIGERAEKSISAQAETWEARFELLSERIQGVLSADRASCEFLLSAQVDALSEAMERFGEVQRRSMLCDSQQAADENQKLQQETRSRLSKSVEELSSDIEKLRREVAATNESVSVHREEFKHLTGDLSSEIAQTRTKINHIEESGNAFGERLESMSRLLARSNSYIQADPFRGSDRSRAGVTSFPAKLRD